MARNQKKVVRFARDLRLNLIPFFTFVVIFIFLGIQIIRGLNKQTVTIYEVQNSYIDNNIEGTAIAIRQEHMVVAPSSGYVNYYARDGEKVGLNATVYTIDQSGNVYDMIADSSIDDTTLSTDNYDTIRKRIAIYQNYYSDSSFGDIYNFKYDIENLVLELSNEMLIDQYTAATGENLANTFQKVVASESGIVSYSQDGYESIEPQEITKDDFNTNDYSKTTLKTGEIIEAQSPVYKVITSEIWNLVLPLSEEDANRLKEDTRVTLHLPNIGKDIYGDIEIIHNNANYYANITLDKLMINYYNERYLDVEIVMDKSEGLKIPNSSITTKMVYKIPISYLSNGSNSTQKIFFNVRTLDNTGNPSITQITPDIYTQDENYCYVDPNDFETDAILVANDSTTTQNITSFSTTDLPGVYCVNKGAATFKRIDTIVTNDDFTIIRPDIDYGISLYDHIVLDSSTISENELIH